MINACTLVVYNSSMEQDRSRRFDKQERKRQNLILSWVKRDTLYAILRVPA